MEEELNPRKLIIRFLAGEITEAEADLLKSWLSEDSGNRRIFDIENELWQESDFQSKLKYFDTGIGWHNISSKLGIGERRYHSVIIIKRYKLRILLAAASIAFLVGIGGLALWLSGKFAYKNRSASTTVITDEGERANLFLSDSTLIIMNSGSKLEYTSDYNIEGRVLKFSGEAFFDVHTDPENPLVVQLDKMTISSIGTRFNILSYDNEDRIETTLEEGKIRVLVEGNKVVDIKPDQQVVYETKTGELTVRDVVTETYTSWIENKLKLVDTPLEEAFRKIARRYNVIFEIKSRELLELKYTATFIDESIEDVMKMLKIVSPIEYKIYNRTGIEDKKYLKPRIVVWERKS